MRQKTLSTIVFLCSVYYFNLIQTTDAYVNDISYEYSNSSLARIKRQSGCNGFQCKTTRECIDIDKQCDGKEDCTDGSDEYESLCKRITCPGYLFKCDYGACINIRDKCNGVRDCKDGSDEADCPNLIGERINSNCRSDEFECRNGECVVIDGKCDGIADCQDKSDESRDICFNIYCPGYTYKCEYGACVDGNARCNGVKNCLDNSDEENCGPTPPPTPAPPDIQPDEPTVGYCITPKQPNFGQWVFSYNDQRGSQGQRVDVNTIIKFSCNKGYKLSSSERNEEFVGCGANGWTFIEMPHCEQLCKPYYSTQTTILKCKSITGSEITCDKATNGTVLTFTCAPYYKVPSNTHRYCFDGTWDHPQPECIQVCGEKRVSATALVVGGTNVIRGDYPWVVAIYALKAKTTDTFVHICGGSIIKRNIILTAAHCVTNNKGQANEPTRYRVAGGKYYNKYHDSEDENTAQYAGVKEIVLNPLYRGDTLHYLGDMALLILEIKFALSKVVQPVCYNGVNYMDIDLKSVGIVNGWGYTRASGQPSNVLKELKIPFKDETVCRSEFPPEWADKYLLDDKMCGGYLNKDTSVCKGDSGGGLVFKNPADNNYYIHGIVSVAHSIDAFTCDIQKSALFTKIKSHYDWLDRQIASRSRDE